MKKLLYLPIFAALIAVFGAGRSVNGQDRMNDRDVKALTSRMEHDADRFKHSLHEEMEHAHWEDKRDRESMNRAASDFEQATDRLKGHFHDGNARPADVQEVLDRGAAIDGMIMGRHLLPRVRTDWVALRGDLDQLATAYNINWSWPQAPGPESAPPDR